MQDYLTLRRSSNESIPSNFNKERGPQRRRHSSGVIHTREFNKLHNEEYGGWIWPISFRDVGGSFSIYGICYYDFPKIWPWISY